MFTAMKSHLRATNLSRPLFFLFTGMQLLPLFVFDFIPTADGPLHVYNAKLLLNYLVYRDPLALRFFTLNPVPVPNWLTHFAMAGLMLVTTPHRAETMIMAGYVVLLPLAFRYAIRSIRPDSGGIEFMIFPFVYNSHFHWGFFNFCYSLALFLFVVGYWLRHKSHMTALRTACWSALIVLLYFANPVGFIETLLAVLVLSTWAASTGAYETSLARIRALARSWTVVAVAFLPAFLLYAWYLAFRLNRGRDGTEWPTIRYAAANLLTLAPIQSFVPAERLIGIGLSITLAVVLAVALIRAGRSGTGFQDGGYLLLALVGAAIVMIAPVTATSGTMITPRLVYFPLFALLFWLATQPAYPGFRILIAGAGTVAAVLLIALHAPIYARYQATMKDFLSQGRLLEDRKTAVFTTFDSPFPQNLDVRSGSPPLSAGASGYLAAEHNLILLNDYEAETDHFPLVFQSACNPAGTLFIRTVRGRNDAQSRELNIVGYEKMTGLPVTYLMVWKPTGGRRSPYGGDYSEIGGDADTSLSIYRRDRDRDEPAILREGGE